MIQAVRRIVLIVVGGIVEHVIIFVNKNICMKKKKMSNKRELIDLPKDVLSCILSYVICDYTASAHDTSYKNAICWLCYCFQTWYNPLGISLFFYFYF